MNVKGKTIFDFCKDAEMRKEIIGGDYTESYYKECSEIVKMRHLTEYAAKTNNIELFKASKKELSISEKNFEKRANEAAKEGWIIEC